MRRTLDDILLGLLAAEPQHGYQLLDCFRDSARLGEVLHVSTSQLYAVLKRLHNQGMIVGEEIASPDAPTRTRYHLTDRGRARLEKWLFLPQPSANVRAVRMEFLSRLYIARLLNYPTDEIVRNQQDSCRSYRAYLTERGGAMPPGIGQMKIEFAVNQLSAVLDWIDGSNLLSPTQPANPIEKDEK
jgi:DNA-binding PadR family transcriptional regulator